MLVLVSDGIGEEAALQCCIKYAGQSPGELAAALMSSTEQSGEDDATVVTICLNPGAAAT